MATIDKHPPLDPKRHSTNKRVKPLGENIFGTAVLEAEGAKTSRPGDANTTGAKTMGPGETPKAYQERLLREEQERREAPLLQQESFLSEARRALLKKGSMTQTENEALKIIRGKSNRS